VLCADRAELRDLPLPPERRVIWYGESAEAEIRGADIHLCGRTGGCRVTAHGRSLGSISINTPGVHNILNALGAAAAALAAGAPFPACQQALQEFHGVGRRFEVVGEPRDVTVVDDYAHHPTEVAATIAAARTAFPGRRIVALFQPHLYSRTRDFAEQFARALSRADVTVLTEIYPAREQAIPGITSALIAGRLRQVTGEDAVLEVAKESLTTELPAHVRAGDVILSMGAGDIGREARALAHRLGGSPSPDQEVVAKQ
jgi:UDP-N-acetylmuramate--alanine ligase